MLTDVPRILTALSRSHRDRTEDEAEAGEPVQAAVRQLCQSLLHGSNGGALRLLLHGKIGAARVLVLRKDQEAGVDLGRSGLRPLRPHGSGSSIEDVDSIVIQVAHRRHRSTAASSVTP